MAQILAAAKQQEMRSNLERVVPFRLQLLQLRRNAIKEDRCLFLAADQAELDAFHGSDGAVPAGDALAVEPQICALIAADLEGKLHDAVPLAGEAIEQGPVAFAEDLQHGGSGMNRRPGFMGSCLGLIRGTTVKLWGGSWKRRQKMVDGWSEGHGSVGSTRRQSDKVSTSDKVRSKTTRSFRPSARASVLASS
jgi:hypothetical protein